MFTIIILSFPFSLFTQEEFQKKVGELISHESSSLTGNNQQIRSEELAQIRKELVEHLGKKNRATQQHEKISYFQRLLEDKEKRDGVVKLLLDINEIKQVNSYLGLDELAAQDFVKNLSVFHHVQLIRSLGSLGLINKYGFDDCDNAVQLLVNRKNTGNSQENIEYLLQVANSLHGTISSAIKEELLQQSEFYRFSGCSKNKVMKEEQLTEALIMKRYWKNIIHLCDGAGNILKEYRHVSHILKMDNVLVIGMLREGIVKLIDLRDNLCEREIQNVIFNAIFKINNKKIAIASMGTNRNNGYVIVYDIEKNQGKKIGEIVDTFRVSDCLIATKVGWGNPRMDEFGDAEYTAHMLKFCDVEKDKFNEELCFKNLLISFRLTDHTIAMQSNNEVTLYNVETGETTFIELQGLTGLFCVNDHTIALSTKDIIKTIDIKTNKSEQFDNLGQALRVDDHTIVTYGNNGINLCTIDPGKVKSVVLSEDKESIAFIKGINLIKDLAIVHYMKKHPLRELVDVFNVINGKLLNRMETIDDLIVVENTIWLISNGVLKRLGPGSNLKKLDAEQLLLCLSALRSGKQPSKVNNDIWESINDAKKQVIEDYFFNSA